MELAAKVAQVAASGAAFGLLAYVLAVRDRSRPHLKPGVSQAVVRLLHRGRRKLLSSIIDVGGFFGLDIGGSLTKLVFFMPDAVLIEELERRVPSGHTDAAAWRGRLAAVKDVAAFMLSRASYGGTGVRDDHLSFHISELGGSFHFVRFETRRMPGALDMAATHGLAAGITNVCTTGGGAHRFAAMARSVLNVTLDARDEIDCLVKGLAFLMGYVECEAYTFHGKNYVDRPMTGIKYPYMLVNVGSGVGFILVHSETRWERVSGTSLGGGTFYGLCHLLTGETSFDAMLGLAETGMNANVDLTVGDIYGGDYTKFGLKSSTIASSFGKAITWNFGAAAAGAAGADGGSGGGGGGGGGGGVYATRQTRADTAPLPPHTSLAATAAAYEASARAALATVASDAGSFGASVIGGRALPRSVAAQLPLSPGSALPSAAAVGGSSRAALRIGAGGGGGIGRTPGAATPLVPREASPSVDTTAPSAAAAAAAEAAAAGSTGGGGGGAAGGAGRYANEDMARSLLIMVSNNIGQLAYLNAVRYNCPHVYFAGNFLRNENTIAMRTLAYAITFWAQGAMEALFLRHEGYCGALGAFLSTLEGAESDDA